MDWYKTSKTNVVKISNYQFEIYENGKKIGQAYLDTSSKASDRWVLSAIDIDEERQKQGYGTLLLQAIAKDLKARGVKELASSNTGSGTVQLMEKVFGQENVKHFIGSSEIDGKEARRIMDVDFGYTYSIAYIR